ncbi:MAG: hypothetical protein SPF67_05890 [Eubacteriales bacterium]|nr:hypothetical protein [Eubacterium sp.]MDY5494064.1 hypothetical protein [Eubacteriales bacterium]
MKKLISIFVAISLLISVIMFSGCSQRIIKCHNHCSRICYAMKEGNDEEFLRLVSDKKFNLNQYDALKIFEFFEGIRRTPLQETCYLENPYYVEKLLENGADPNYPKLGKEDTNLLPLPLATGYSIVDLNHTQNAVKIVEMLLEYGADPNVILRRGRTCLIDVVELEPKYYNEYHYEIVKLLVEYGTDISIKDQDGFTAYDYAVKYNRTELYDLLKP